MAQQIAYSRCEGMQQMHQSVITQLAVAHAHLGQFTRFRMAMAASAASYCL
jgi:hypothetical protein